jgi:DNA-binding response OmpR family regulator
MSVAETVEQPTVLVADDDPDVVALVARRLSKAGYKVITASDGEEALQMAQEHLPDLAVLDVMMPKLTGLDVTRRLREEPATENMLVMLISAGFESDDMFGAPDGADDHLKKPFAPHELPNRVEAVLAR